MRINMLGQEAEKLEQQMQLIEEQIREFNAVKTSLEGLAANDQEKEILANLGKGIFVKSKTIDNKLFINVGKEIIVRKSPGEALEIIASQLMKLEGHRTFIIGKINELQENMMALIQNVQSESIEPHTEDKDKVEKRTNPTPHHRKNKK